MAQHPRTASSTGGPLDLVLVLLLGTAVSFVGSWHVSLWTDEAISISAAGRSWSDLAAMVSHVDAVHAAYYASLKLWVELFGTSAWVLRLPSALAVGATGAGALALGRLLATRRTAWSVAVVCVLLPRMTWAGIEARPFVFSALAAVWATWALVVALQRGGSLRWAAYGVLAAVGVALNIYLVMLVMGHAVTTLLWRRRAGRAVGAFFVTAAAVAAVTSPLLLLVRSQQAQLGGGAPSSLPFLVRRVVVNQYFLGETPLDGVYGRWFDRAWEAGAVVLCLTGAVLAVLALVRRPSAGDDRRALLLVAVPWVLVPTVLVVTYATLVSPLYQPRYLTFTVPAAAVVLGLGLRSLRGWALALVGVLLVAGTGVVHVSQRLEYAKSGMDWSTAAAVVAACARPGDAVVFEPRDDSGPQQRSTRRIEVAYPAAFEGLRDATLRRTPGETATLDGESSAVPEVASGLAGDRVWVLFGRSTDPGLVERDAAALASVGLVEVGRWRGPHTTVREYLPQDAASPAELPACAAGLPGDAAAAS